jgi:hypothetical protein
MAVQQGASGAPPKELGLFRDCLAVGGVGSFRAGLLSGDDVAARKRSGSPHITRAQLIALLNEDLAGEYQAIISYIVYSQAIKGMRA